jgi:hypothetical protein
VVDTRGRRELELWEQRSRFTDHIGPGDERHIPGWHTIASGAGDFGLNAAQTERLHAASKPPPQPTNAPFERSVTSLGFPARSSNPCQNRETRVLSSLR